jgi:hypothetical protein
MVLTATITPFVPTFVHQSLRLNEGTAMIHRKVDRREIYLSTQTIKHSLSTYQDLDFLLPAVDTLNSPADIIPTCHGGIPGRQPLAPLAGRQRRLLRVTTRSRPEWLERLTISAKTHLDGCSATACIRQLPPEPPW